MVLLLGTRKMFCGNPDCGHKTFAERFDFVAPNAQKTKRLIDKILIASTKLSSVSATTLLKSNSIRMIYRILILGAYGTLGGDVQSTLILGTYAQKAPDNRRG